MITKTQIEMALSHVNDPDLGQSLTQLGMIENIAVDGMRVSFDLVLTTPACPMKNRMKDECIDAIHQYVDRNAEVAVNLTSRAPKQPDPQQLLPGVKHTILVASGKGGVGKSTVAANLAVALAAQGAQVGLVDADIYGPSIPMMFGIEPDEVYGKTIDGKQYMLPVERFGIKIMSIGLLVDTDKALAWRGPMASSALKQLVGDTWWGELDYLVCDMPPGTGDIQLTVAQTMPVSGAVIVSTPQQVALADVVRGVQMFRTPGIDIPVLGLVENMAWFTPAELPQNRYYIFGREGVSRMAQTMGLPLLGQIPLVQSIAESGDSGRPAALWSPTPTTESQAFANLATNVVKQLCVANQQQQ